MATVLTSPYFQRDFIIYSFATEMVVASIFTQRNTMDEELPISFMSKTLHDYELRFRIGKSSPISSESVGTLSKLHTKFSCNCVCSILSCEDAFKLEIERRKMGKLAVVG
jgi:hypothetical protein